jgi:acetyl-CoA acetyltransferase
MSGAAIIGTGLVPFGKHLDRDLVGLAGEAAYLALKDAGIKPDRVGLGYFASASAAAFLGDMTVGQNVFWEVGISRIPIVNVENACTSGSTAAYLACRAVASGQAEVALVVGAEKMFVKTMGLLNSGANEIDTLLGMVAPAGFAMRAARHIKEFGTTPEQLAMVSVKNRRHAAANPAAQYRTPVTLEEVLASPMIVDPLTKLQCCPIADGAAAIVVTSAGSAKTHRRSVKVKSAVYCTGGYDNPQDLVRWETDYRACRQAYEEAGIGPEDLNVVECHDAFTIAEILHYEALGLCETGQGGRMVQDGHTALGGKIPVNVSGGLLSRGHPIAATGLAQIHEIVAQLRGEAGPRQIAGARVGLAHCMGGDKAADSKSCTVVVLSN